MYTAADRQYMTRALGLARLGLFTTTPNPRVGCVIVKDDQIVGEGCHRRAGEPHAEALALAEAGERARDATVYVTLEPCAHVGRMPPCCDLLVEAGVARVIAAMEDPNPLVNGKGLARLRAAGVDVRCGLMGQEAAELNIGFISRMTRQRPWMRVKLAASLDGRSALSDGRSKWITGERARSDGHRWRARACAVLTGIGTVKADNPAMTVREIETSRQPVRVLIDSRLDVNPAAEIVRQPGAIVYHALEDGPAARDRVAMLADVGCELVCLPDANGKVDLVAACRDLAGRHFNEIHVEAGFKLNGSLFRAGCVDELLIYLAPCLLGGGAPMFDLPEVSDLESRYPLEWVDTELLGSDLRLRARVLRPGADGPRAPASATE